jgi:hypothetical protein
VPIEEGTWMTAEQKIRAMVERGGVSLQFVPQPMVLETCWYTIGLTGHGHPELIVFGLAPAAAKRVLNTLAGEIVAGRRAVTAGGTADDILDDGPVRFVAVEDPDRHLPGAAQVYAGDGALRAVQIVWPDRHRRWPWDAGTKVDAMPVLGEPG